MSILGFRMSFLRGEGEKEGGGREGRERGGGERKGKGTGSFSKVL